MFLVASFVLTISATAVANGIAKDGENDAASLNIQSPDITESNICESEVFASKLSEVKESIDSPDSAKDKMNVSSKSTESKATTSSKNLESKANTSSKSTESKATTSSKNEKSKADTSSKNAESKADTSSKSTENKADTCSKNEDSKATTSSKSAESKADTSSKSAESKANTSSKSTESKADTSSKNEESKATTSSKNTESKSTDSSKQATKISSEKVQLKVPYYCQWYDMPTGCELVSTRMALEYYGIKVSYDDILKHLNRSDLRVDKKGRLYGQSPNMAFIGNPKQNSGFGCYPSVIADMVNSMELDDVRVDDTSSLSLDFVAETYLTLGFPVLVWATIGMGDAPKTDSWYLVDETGKITDKKYTWLANEHCLVMVGYDKNYYYFNDPMAGYATVKYSRELVEKRYKEIGSYSLVIRND